MKTSRHAALKGMQEQMDIEEMEVIQCGKVDGTGNGRVAVKRS